MYLHPHTHMCMWVYTHVRKWYLSLTGSKPYYTFQMGESACSSNVLYPLFISIHFCLKFLVLLKFVLLISWISEALIIGYFNYPSFRLHEIEWTTTQPHLNIQIYISTIMCNYCLFCLLLPVYMHDVLTNTTHSTADNKSSCVSRFISLSYSKTSLVVKNYGEFFISSEYKIFLRRAIYLQLIIANHGQEKRETRHWWMQILVLLSCYND